MAKITEKYGKTEIEILEPSLGRKKYHWGIKVGNKSMSGRAHSEPEAWRLVRDAEKFFNSNKRVIMNEANRNELNSPSSYPRCGTCKHFEKQPPMGSWRDTKWLCGRIYEEGDRDDEAVTFNHFGDDSGLRVSPNFGCLLHSDND